jgi:hypothetical protein
VWYSVEGEVDGPDFEKLATERASSGGPSYNRRRWFCETDELVRANGTTYAFSNQWGGSAWHTAMNLLKEKYPQFKIDFSPAS